MLVSLAEVKQYLRVTFDDDDMLLEQLITWTCTSTGRTRITTT